MSGETLRLALPSEEHLDEVSRFREEFLAANSGMDGAGPLRRCPDPRDLLAVVRAYADPAKVPEEGIDLEQYWIAL